MPLPAWLSVQLCVDVVLAVLIAEAAWLLARRRAPGMVLGAIGPAVCIMLAWRVQLHGGPLWATGLLLALAFPLHLADMRARPLRGRRR